MSILLLVAKTVGVLFLAIVLWVLALMAHSDLLSHLRTKCPFCGGREFKTRLFQLTSDKRSGCGHKYFLKCLHCNKWLKQKDDYTLITSDIDLDEQEASDKARLDKLDRQTHDTNRNTDPPNNPDAGVEASKSRFRQ